MNFSFNENEQMVAEIAREYTDQIADRIDEIEESDHYPEDLFEMMAEMGFIGINLPEEYGGLELGYTSNVVALEHIAKVSPSAATLLDVTQLPLEAIEAYGNPEQKEKYLPDGIAGKFRGSFAFTEADTGSDPKMLHTIAKKTGDGKYIINGMKRFISNAAYNGPIIVFCKEAETEACTAFIVEKFCNGYSLSLPWDKVGLQGSNVYDVFFDDVEVTEADILGERGKGFDILIGATTYGKMSFSAVFTGAMSGAYELAVRYAKEKTLRGGKTLAKFPTTQVSIAHIAGNVESSRMLLYKTAYDADQIKGNIRLIQSETALLKGHVAKVAPETTMMALNIMGSYGVTKEYQVERLMRDVMIAPNIEGAADVQRLIAGSYILRS